MELIGLVNKVVKVNDTEFEQIEFPLEGHRENKNLDGKGWIIEWEKDYNKEQLHNFIFDYDNYLSTSGEN